MQTEKLTKTILMQTLIDRHKVNQITQNSLFFSIIPILYHILLLIRRET